MSKSEFEFVERPGSQKKRSQGSRPRSRPVKMWVLFEGEEDAEKFVLKEDDFKDLDEFLSADLDDFKSVLRKHYPFLKSVENKKIALFNESLERLDPVTNLNSLNVGESSATKIIVRYPISAVNIKVTFIWGKKQGKREIPHTSGSFSFLIAFAKEKFDDLREEEIYFVNDETEILDAYNFNTLVSSQTAQDGNIAIKLKVMVKGRKKYSDWNIKDVFKDILGRWDYESLGDMQRFNFDELPPLNHQFTLEKINQFFEELRCHLTNIQKELDNESSARFIIDTFLSAAVSHIHEFVDDSVRLGFEKELKGSRGYGPIDYVIKTNEICLVLCEAKLQDMKQGMAQNIVQVHSALEQQLKSGQAEPKMYGIVTTGKLWRFVRWTRSLDEPVVHVSEEYTCNFTGNLENEEKMIKYIAQILQDQIDAKGERSSKRIKCKN